MFIPVKEGARPERAHPDADKASYVLFELKNKLESNVQPYPLRHREL